MVPQILKASAESEMSVSMEYEMAEIGFNSVIVEHLIWPEWINTHNQKQTVCCGRQFMEQKGVQDRCCRSEWEEKMKRGKLHANVSVLSKI